MKRFVCSRRKRKVLNEKKIFSKVKSLFESVSTEEKVSGRMVALLLAILISFLMIVICVMNLIQSFTSGHNKKTEINQEVEVTTTTASVTEPVTETVVTTVSEYVLNATQINQFEYEQLIEAEDTVGSELQVASDVRTGYSGRGYLTGFYPEDGNSLRFEFDIPSEQHYDISVCFASDYIVKNEIYLNGEPLFDFACTEATAGKFVIKTYYGVFLEKGKSVLTVHETEGEFDLDYIKIRNNQSIYSSRTDISPELINAAATPEAKNLMQYLADNFGKRIVTGQYVSSAQDVEITKIQENTSQSPAIRFGDMSQYSVNSNQNIAPEDDDISAAMKWAEQGGIVGYMWHWKAPVYEDEFYSEKTQFDLSLAVTDIDVAMLTPQQIDNLYQEGMLTAETVSILYDIDLVSAQLQRLYTAHIPVLWRPLHEASGDWFWWGAAGPEAYRWLWNVLYTRQTYYHHLDNLIWIWSAQGTDYFVGNDMFDIAAVDLYDENTDNTSYYKQYQWLYSLTGGEKLIALSECGRLPDMELTFRDRAVWSFFGLWYGDYILDKNGMLSEKYNSREAFVKMYNSNRTITLEKYKNKSELKEEPVVTTQAVVTTAVTETAEPEIPQPDAVEPSDAE